MAKEDNHFAQAASVATSKLGCSNPRAFGGGRGAFMMMSTGFLAKVCAMHSSLPFVYDELEGKAKAWLLH